MVLSAALAGDLCKLKTVTAADFKERIFEDNNFSRFSVFILYYYYAKSIGKVPESCYDRYEMVSRQERVGNWYNTHTK